MYGTTSTFVSSFSTTLGFGFSACFSTSADFAASTTVIAAVKSFSAWLTFGWSALASFLTVSALAFSLVRFAKAFWYAETLSSVLLVVSAGLRASTAFVRASSSLALSTLGVGAGLSTNAVLAASTVLMAAVKSVTAWSTFGWSALVSTLTASALAVSVVRAVKAFWYAATLSSVLLLVSAGLRVSRALVIAASRRAFLTSGFGVGAGVSFDSAIATSVKGSRVIDLSS